MIEDVGETGMGDENLVRAVRVLSRSRIKIRDGRQVSGAQKSCWS